MKKFGIHGTRLAAILLVTFVMCLAYAFLSHAQPIGPFYLDTLELGGSEHTRADGTRFSSVLRKTVTGYYAGTTTRFEGGNDYLGSSAWLFGHRGRQVEQIGFTGETHTSALGEKRSTVLSLSESGLVLGRSQSYDHNSGFTGDDYWVFDSSDRSHTQIGFYSGEFAHPEYGISDQKIHAMSDSGHVSGTSNQSEQAAWIYDPALRQTKRVGLLDAEHTRENGYRYSGFVLDIKPQNGLFVGVSTRWKRNSDIGNSLWLYDVHDETTTVLGLRDSEHTALNGVRRSEISRHATNGFILGQSHRYGINASDLGRTAWLYNHQSRETDRIGFYDAEHTRENGYQYSRSIYLHGQNLAFGESRRYNGLSEDLGQSAWVYDLNDRSTIRVGFDDAEHTRSDGYQYSSLNTYTLSGQFIGSSYRYLGGNVDLGNSAWVLDQASNTTVRIGYTDAKHTRLDGYRYSSANHATASGLVAGSSQQYSGDSYIGQSTWVFRLSDRQLTRIGLMGDEYINAANGGQFSQIMHMTGQGYVGGVSIQYSASGQGPRSHWVYNPADDETNRVGLFDEDHTRSDGWQESRFDYWSEAGAVAGYSYRYSSSESNVSLSAWVYDARSNTTIQVGYTDATHTQTSGYQFSRVYGATDQGLFWGGSNRYEGNKLSGTTPWVFDSNTMTLHNMVLDQYRDLRGGGLVQFITDDGLAVATNVARSDTGEILSQTIVAWSSEIGLIDLSPLIQVDFKYVDWAFIEEVTSQDGLGGLLGIGYRGTDGANYAVPVVLTEVPEPTSLACFFSTLLLATRRNRSTR